MIRMSSNAIAAKTLDWVNCEASPVLGTTVLLSAGVIVDLATVVVERVRRTESMKLGLRCYR